MQNLLVRVGADLSGLNSGMARAKKSVSGLGKHVEGISKNLKGQLAGLAAGITGVFMLKQATNDAAKFEALMTTLAESLGPSIKGFEEWQEKVGSAMGFSKLQGAELANMLSLNFKRMATSQEDLLSKTTKMMETAAIISNKRGMAMTEVSDRIRSAMNQEADGADELGVNVRIAAIQQSKAYKEMADGAPWDKLTENMRKTILYHHILESVAGNLGAHLSDTTALRINVFKASLDDLRLALGTAFLPIIHTVLPILNGFIRSIERALKAVYSFTYGLFGYKGAGQAKKAAGATDDQAAAIGGVGEAADKAGKKIKKAAKEAKRGVMGFDEVNILQDIAKDTGGAGAGAGAAAGEGIAPPDNFQAIKPSQYAWMKELNEKAKNLGETFRKFFKTSKGWETLTDAWGRLKKSIKGLWDSVEMKGFTKWLKGGWGKGIDGVFKMVAGAVDILAGAIDILTFLITGDFSNAWKGIGKMLRGIAEFISGVFSPLFPEWGKKFDDFTEKFFDGWEKIGDIGYADLLGGAFKAFITLKDDAVKNLGKIVDETPKKMALIDVAVKLGLGPLANWFKVNITDKWIGHLGSAQKPAKDKSSGVWSNIKAAFTDPDWFEKNVADKMWKALSEKKKTIGDKAADVWSEIKKKFAPAAKWFDDNIADPVVKAYNEIKKGFSISYKEGFKAIYNNAAKFINMVIRGINKMTRKMNDLPGISGIPEIDTIPYLAKGGITSGPTLAMVGDNPGGKEVISPLDDLKSMIGTAVMTAIQATGGNNAASGNVTLNIDGRTFARLVSPYLERENRRVGPNVRLNSI